MTLETRTVRNPDQTLIDDLGAKLQDLGITTLALDFDDTLAPTRQPVFMRRLNEAAAILSGSTKNSQAVTQRLHTAMRAIGKQLHVHPSLSAVALHLAALESGIDPQSETYKKARDIVDRIYDDVPLLFDGALRTIDIFNATGVRVILTTHAEPEWTWRKIKANNLFGKFAQVHCFDVNRSKSEQWEIVYAREKVNPRNLGVVGDNLHSDIIRPVSQGAFGVWITNNEAFSTEHVVHHDHGLTYLEAPHIAKVPEIILAA